MPTLKDRLLDGRVIGETFRIDNPQLLGDLPKLYSYQVEDLISGVTKGLEFVNLIAKGEDGREHHFPLASRFNDIYIPIKPSQLDQITQTPLTPEQAERIGGCHHTL